jgi:hypothetical protein
MITLAAVVALMISLGVVLAHPRPTLPGMVTVESGSWTLESYKSMVVFGDSYTDESRILYLASHAGLKPPAGWVPPVVS